MYNKTHIPYENYMIEKCEEYGWDWKKANKHFQEIVKNKLGIKNE